MKCRRLKREKDLKSLLELSEEKRVLWWGAERKEEEDRVPRVCCALRYYIQ